MTNLPPLRFPLPHSLTQDISRIEDLRYLRSSLVVAVRHLWAAAELISGGLLAVPQYEAKLALGYHLFVLTDLIRDLEHRLDELGTPERLRRRGHTTIVDVKAVIKSADSEEILCAIYDTVVPASLEQLRKVRDAGGEVADAPTRRIIRLHLPELEEAATWGDKVVSIIRTHGRDSASSEVVELYPSGRPLRPARDDRFTLFSNTRDYGHDSPDIPPYETQRLELVRTNRDEIDAIETFALVYFDLLDDAPIDMLWDLARTGWDEVRHSLLGHQLLAIDGQNPFDYPCSMIGIEVRSRLGGWDALAQISLFGELNIIGPMRALAYSARASDDEITARAFDFICSDESLHLRRIRRWLKERHPLADIDDIEKHTKQRSGAVLEELGIMGEEYFVNLTSAQIFELLGE